MTEKKAPFGNNFTPEQRSAALKRAADMRAARAEYLGRVKSGEVSITDALEAGKGDPVRRAHQGQAAAHGLAGHRRLEGAERHDRNRHRGVPPRRGHRAATGRKARRTVRVGAGRRRRSPSRGKRETICEAIGPSPIGRRPFLSDFQGVWMRVGRFPFGKHGRVRRRSGLGADSIEGGYTRGAGGAR